MKKLISVIIPVYKNIHFLRDALESLKFQTNQDFEVIVINDGSKEIEKIKKITNLFKKNFKLILITYKNNKGVSFALNKGIKKSKGKYISWLSHDDYFHPRKLDAQIKCIKENKSKIIFTGFYIVNHKKDIIKKKMYKGLRFKTKHNILFRDDLNLSTALITKKIFSDVGYFDVTKKHVQDYDIMHRIFQKYNPFIINEPLFFSRVHKKQTSKILQDDATYEKKIFIISKLNIIKNIFKKSSIFFKNIYSFFFKVKKY